MGTTMLPQGKAMYVAPKSDRAWLLNEQRKLYRRSWEKPECVFEKLWGLVTDHRNLRTAVARVARNRGKRTGGVDRVTVRMVVRDGVDTFVETVRAELRSGSYRPAPVRRVLIPKPGQLGKFRPLGIPTVKDRVVQSAVKNILEPIFEAGFYPNSYGFRPGRSVHGALEHLRMLLRPRESRQGRRLPYQWAIEGDIKGCFDNIGHHPLMDRIRRRVGDLKVTRLVLAFLKAGVMSESQFSRTETGTPQGGILSPLLANIALGTIEERYERFTWPRRIPTTRRYRKTVKRIEEVALKARERERRSGGVVLIPIRYADDFLILVGAAPGPGQDDRAREAALGEKEALAKEIKERLGLELSAAKTLVTPVTKPMRFLGHHVRVRPHPVSGRMVSTTVIPRDRSQRLREEVKDLFGKGTTAQALEVRLHHLNRLLRGWGNFYRHAWGAKRVFQSLANHVWWTIFRWLKKRHRRVAVRRLFARYGRKRPSGWQDGSMSCLNLGSIPVQQYKLAWMRPPSFVEPPMESPVRSERRTPGSERGARKPAGETR